MAKYIPVGEPSNDSERRGIRELRDHLPDHYVVIGNFDLNLPRRRNTLEFDAVVVGEWGLHAVEIKGWTGPIRGDQRTWELEWGRVQNPFQLNEKKAKALRDLLVQHLDYLPGDVFCQSVVFLPREGVRYEVDDGNAERLLVSGQVHDFFVDEERVYAKGPGALLDEGLRQQVVDTIIPLADPAPGLPRVESYEIQGELDRRDVPYREFVGEHKFLKNRRKVRLKRYEIDPLLSDAQRDKEFNKVLRDMEALESLEDNPYVARAHEMLLDREDEQIFYLVSEWVGPRTLRDFISELEGPLMPGDAMYHRALELALHLLRAVRFMHDRSIVHRNLHPRVVYLTEDQQSVPLKIADFDYARVADLQSIAGDVSDIGTEGYAAPELWSNDDYDHCVDMFSVGAMIFEMFAGGPLFESIDQMLDMEGIWQRKRSMLCDDDLREMVAGLIDRTPDRRKCTFERAISDFQDRLQP
ncbi:MAG: NERD domain-containing protein kinase family protein [Myxococcota bacterium]